MVIRAEMANLEIYGTMISFLTKPKMLVMSREWQMEHGTNVVVVNYQSANSKLFNCYLIGCS